MRIAIAAALAIFFVGSASAQSDEPMPPACRENAQGRVDYQACYNATTAGSGLRAVAAMNLGTVAFMQNDPVTAVRYYDEAQPHDGTRFYSDASFHAFYGSTLHQVGREAEALEQARMSLAILRNDPALPQAIRERFVPIPVDREAVFALLLPVFHANGAPETASVQQDYMRFAPNDWIGWANRAGVLEQINDLPGALDASQHALALAPAEPGVLNNHCYILARSGRAAEGVPYCERAVAAVPNVASVRHSLASALAGAGQCTRAREELARARQFDPLSPEYQQDIPCTPARR